MMRRMLRLRGMPPHHRPRRRQVPPPKQALRSLLLPLLSPAPAHLRLVRQSPARSLVLLNPAPRNPVRVTLLVALRSLVRLHSALVELVPVMAPQPPRKAALCRAPWPSQDRSLALVRRG